MLWRVRHDINPMKHLTALIVGLSLALGVAGPAVSQVIQGPTAPPIPQPPPPPPPKIEVPPVPKMDAPPTPPRAQKQSSRRSYGDRVANCLADGAAAGLGPNERADYSRACANR